MCRNSKIYRTLYYTSRVAGWLAIFGLTAFGSCLAEFLWTAGGSGRGGETGPVWSSEPQNSSIFWVNFGCYEMILKRLDGWSWLKFRVSKNWGFPNNLYLLFQTISAQSFFTGIFPSGSKQFHRVQDADLMSLRSWLQKLRGAHADPNFRFTSLPPGQRTLQRLLSELEVFEQQKTRLGRKSWDVVGCFGTYKSTIELPPKKMNQILGGFWKSLVHQKLSRMERLLHSRNLQRRVQQKLLRCDLSKLIAALQKQVRQDTQMATGRTLVFDREQVRFYHRPWHHVCSRWNHGC